MNRYFLLFIFGFFISILSEQCVFDSIHLSPDENSYEFQSKLFLLGKIKQNAHPLKEFFNQPMIIHQDYWLSRYPPGHCLALIPGVYFGYTHLMPAVFSGLTLIFMFLILNLYIKNQKIVWVSLLYLCGTPFYFLTVGTNLSEITNLCLLLGFTYFSSRYININQFKYLLIAYMFFGFSFWVRPYSALCFSLPLHIYFFYQFWKKNKLKYYIRMLGFWSFLFLGGYLFYNYLATGSPWIQPYDYYMPGNGLGFGIRDNGMIHFTYQIALKHTWKNILLFSNSVLGYSYLLIPLFFIGFVFLEPMLKIYLLSALGLIVGYIFFWFSGQDFSGPIYYFEAIGIVVIVGTIFIQKMMDHRPKIFQILFSFIVLLILGAGLKDTYAQLWSRHGAIINELKTIQKNLNEIHDKSIVFVQSQFYRSDDTIIRNDPDLYNQIIMVNDLGYSNEALMYFYPDRKYFLLFSDPMNHNKIQPIYPRSEFRFELNSKKYFDLDVGYFDSDPDDPFETVRIFDAKPNSEGLFIKNGPDVILSPGIYELDFNWSYQVVNSNSSIWMKISIKNSNDQILKEFFMKDEDDLKQMSLFKFELQDYQKIKLEVYLYPFAKMQIKNMTIKKTGGITDGSI